MASLISYMSQNSSQIISLLLEHIEMTVIAVVCAILIGVPLGILISYIKKLGKPIMGVANIIQAIPSMAMLGLAIPLLGIGVLPAVVMVTIYSLLPIIKNTYTGISSIDPDLVEAAAGIGLTKWQVLSKIKIPMALPVIMAGVRISAVTAVGLMTMAAFIGAGGLGFLVFSGIRTVNNAQILAGAIPACILALVVDYLMAIIEKLVTPISLQKSFSKSKEQLKKQRKKQKVTLGIIVALIVAMVGNSFIAGAKKNENTITIGAKDFTEQVILCHLYADMIEHDTDLKVIRKENLGGSQVAFGAMKSNEIDMYIDYTGTLYVSILKHKAKSDEMQVFNETKKELDEKYNLKAFDPTVFNNVYTLAVKAETAKKYGLENISDLKKCDDEIRLGATLEFLNREDDGLPGLVKKYGFNFKDTIGIDNSPRFLALENNKVDMIDAFATDGLLKKYNLTVLKDSDKYFPPYNAVPVATGDTYKKHPEIEASANKLSKVLTNEVMQELNYKVDEEGQEPRDVARDFLKEKGLI